MDIHRIKRRIFAPYTDQNEISWRYCMFCMDYRRLSEFTVDGRSSDGIREYCDVCWDVFYGKRPHSRIEIVNGDRYNRRMDHPPKRREQYDQLIRKGKRVFVWNMIGPIYEWTHLGVVAYENYRAFEQGETDQGRIIV